MNRTDELVNEIKTLRETISDLNSKLNSKDFELHTKTSEIANLKATVHKLNEKVTLVQSEKQHIQKKCQNQIKKLETDVKRNDIFSNKLNLTSKTKKEYFMIQEMDVLRKVNRTLLGFVDVLSDKYEFDGDLVKTLCEIAEGTDDIILRHFLANLKNENSEKNINARSFKNSENNEIITSNEIKTTDEIVK